jgi:hypothetical protein
MATALKLNLLADAAAKFYKTPLSRSGGRHGKTFSTKVRHVCQWVALEAGYSTSAIARFWNLDRSAIYYGCRMVNNKIEIDEEEKKQVMEFLAYLTVYLKENKTTK